MNITNANAIKLDQRNLWTTEKWFPFWDWEHWKRGIFQPRATDAKADESAALLKSSSGFISAISVALVELPKCSIHNLSNDDKNHCAFLGWVACFVNHGATKNETCLGWFKLSQGEQETANRIATTAAVNWKQKYVKTIFNNVGL